MNFPANSDVTAWKPVVLAVLQNIAADGMVRTPDVDAAIVATEGFPGWDHWGHIKARGKDYPKARRDMSFALSKLRDEGKVFSPKRGSFTLKVPEQAVATQTVAEAAGAVEVSKAVKAVRHAALSNHPIMEADENLRLRVIEQTKCFGAQNLRSRTCRGCPLAGFCGEAKAVRYAEAAARLAAWVAVEVEAPVVAEQEADEVALLAAAERGDVQLHWAEFPLFCRECRGFIEPGDQFVRVEAEGAYHVGCHAERG
jgi:hypothetical protein